MQSPAVAPMIAEGIVGRRPTPPRDPNRIVVIRLHAFGDAVIALPVIGGLRNRFPESRIVVVTGRLSAQLFEAVDWVDEVVTMAGSGDGWAHQIRRGLGVGRTVASPDVVIDLQRSRASTLVRRLLHPPAWVAFDRFAPRLALDRYLDAVRWLGLEVSPDFDPPIRQTIDNHIDDLLTKAGWNRETLVCLNPAGCWPTKNWTLDRYAELGRELERTRGMRTILIGTERIRKQADRLVELVPSAIDLVGRTTSAEALAVVRRLALMVSDDSGLMHMAAVCGVPTIGLFGASRATWSAPCGPASRVFGSEDMECGACMSPVCRRGDTECLARIGVDRVLEALDERADRRSTDRHI